MIGSRNGTSKPRAAPLSRRHSNHRRARSERDNDYSDSYRDDSYRDDSYRDDSYRDDSCRAKSSTIWVEDTPRDEDMPVLDTPLPVLDTPLPVLNTPNPINVVPNEIQGRGKSTGKKKCNERKCKTCGCGCKTCNRCDKCKKDNCSGDCDNGGGNNWWWWIIVVIIVIIIIALIIWAIRSASQPKKESSYVAQSPDGQSMLVTNSHGQTTVTPMNLQQSMVAVSTPTRPPVQSW